MSRKFTFPEPDSVENAMTQLRTVRGDLTDMNLQLQGTANTDADPDWLRRLRNAMRFKIAEKKFLQEYLGKAREAAEEKIRMSDAKGAINIRAHLKAQSRLMGRLHQLLLSVEEFLETDSDESFERMKNAVDDVREVDYPED